MGGLMSVPVLASESPSTASSSLALSDRAAAIHAIWSSSGPLKLALVVVLKQFTHSPVAILRMLRYRIASPKFSECG